MYLHRQKAACSFCCILRAAKEGKSTKQTLNLTLSSMFRGVNRVSCRTVKLSEMNRTQSAYFIYCTVQSKNRSHLSHSSVQEWLMAASTSNIQNSCFLSPTNCMSRFTQYEVQHCSTICQILPVLAEIRGIPLGYIHSRLSWPCTFLQGLIKMDDKR